MVRNTTRLLPALPGTATRCLAFYDFPAKHWRHIRTTNPIESPCATVRHRPNLQKAACHATRARIMVFKMIKAAGKNWLHLHGRNQLPQVIEEIKFKDDLEDMPVSNQNAAITIRHHQLWRIAQRPPSQGKLRNPCMLSQPHAVAPLSSLCWGPKSGVSQ